MQLLLSAAVSVLKQKRNAPQLTPLLRLQKQLLLHQYQQQQLQREQQAKAQHQQRRRLQQEEPLEHQQQHPCPRVFIANAEGLNSLGCTDSFFLLSEVGGPASEVPFQNLPFSYISLSLDARAMYLFSIGEVLVCGGEGGVPVIFGVYRNSNSNSSRLSGNSRSSNEAAENSAAGLPKADAVNAQQQQWQQPQQQLDAWVFEKDNYRKTKMTVNCLPNSPNGMSCSQPKL